MGALMHFSPGARRNDAPSSHAAVAAHNASGKRQRHTEIIIEQVWLHPGLTSAELTPYTGLDRVEVARRMTDAEETGWIRRGDLKRCTQSRKLGLSWWPNDPTAKCAA